MAPHWWRDVNVATTAAQNTTLTGKTDTPRTLSNKSSPCMFVESLACPRLKQFREWFLPLSSPLSKKRTRDRTFLTPQKATCGTNLGRASQWEAMASICFQVGFNYSTNFFYKDWFWAAACFHDCNIPIRRVILGPASYIWKNNASSTCFVNRRPICIRGQDSCPIFILGSFWWPPVVMDLSKHEKSTAESQPSTCGASESRTARGKQGGLQMILPCAPP